MPAMQCQRGIRDSIIFPIISWPKTVNSHRQDWGDVRWLPVFVWALQIVRMMARTALWMATCCFLDVVNHSWVNLIWFVVVEHNIVCSKSLKGNNNCASRNIDGSLHAPTSAFICMSTCTCLVLDWQYSHRQGTCGSWKLHQRSSLLIFGKVRRRNFMLTSIHVDDFDDFEAVAYESLSTCRVQPEFMVEITLVPSRCLKVWDSFLSLAVRNKFTLWLHSKWTRKLCYKTLTVQVGCSKQK